jgi:glycosyltransferase involved in cell wall biosynthesis
VRVAEARTAQRVSPESDAARRPFVAPPALAPDYAACAITESFGAPVRVMLLLGSLSGGGAERVAVNLVNRCDPAAVDLRLGLLSRTGPFLAEVDPMRVAAPTPGRGGLPILLRGPPDIARMVKQVRPQVLMTFGMGVTLLTWLAMMGLGRDRPRWICREDSNPTAEIDNLLSSRLGRSAVRAVSRRAHGSADSCVAVAHDLAAQLDSRGRPGRRATRVIHNPIDVARIERLSVQPLSLGPRRPFIVTAGRLVHQKGFDLLIEAFARSRAAAGLDLVILGEGPLEAALKAQAAALGVERRVRFPGFQDNPWAWFAGARLFVLPSRWEGFGNVVAEAMASGAPVLVTDCDFGPREQVDHGVNGWVTRSEDPVALAQALDTLLPDRALTAALAAAGTARARAFDVAAIAEAYTDLFLEQAA